MGIVPATGRRGPRPSAKKLSGACARTFIWRTMSGKTSSGGSVLFCPRNPNTAMIAMVNKSEINRNPRNILVFVHDRDVLSAGFLQQFAHASFGKARIARFNRQEKSV